MNFKVEKIALINNDGEIIEIDSKYVGDLIIENIKENITRGADYKFKKMAIAETIGLEISKEGNQNHEFSRLLKSPTIRLVGIGSDQVMNYYRGAYKPSFKHHKNKYQDTYISKQGNCYIIIDKNNKVKDVFDKKRIDNAQVSHHLYLCKQGSVNEL